MGTFYPNSSAQIDVTSTPYIQDQAMIHGNLMMYLNESSSAASFSDIGPVTSISNCVEIPSMAVRNEMMFIPPTSDQLTMQAISDTVDGERNFNGLSLSLSTHLSNAAQPSSFQHFPNAGLSSVLTTHLPDKVDYGQYDFHGDGHSSLRFGAPNNLQYMVNPKGVGYNGYQYEHTSTITSIIKSKYLKAAQQLLDDIVNVQGALKMHESAKDQYMGKVEDKPTESKEKPVLESKATESTSAPSQELSANERQELQNKLDRLVAMLDEVDRRYKQYYHQMQVLVSSFDLIAGSGGSKPYTTLARKTISRNFRTLRDAITVHIQTIRKSLGEQDSGQGAVIPRLRHIDHQLRQQRSLQQFGMMRHAWRPQRGLPENAVTTLRAWLFEHFLNPYPKDSEKIMLARQTGLTRSQVANWFINARVRLWKPMIENMYKEEFAEADLNLKSSPENTPKAAGENPDTAYPGPSHNESKPNIYHQTTETSQSTGRAAMMVNPHAGDNKHRELIKMHEDHHNVTNNHGFYPHDQNSLIEFQVPELSNYGVDNQVSLALGLRRIDGDVEHLSEETTNLRPDASAVNAIGSGTTEYSYFPVNQQHNFGNSHLLNNFVA